MIDCLLSLDGTDSRHFCKCVTKHVPKALELHKHRVGSTTWVVLCPTTHANVHRLWKLYDDHDGRPPWDMLRNYSEYTRAIVERGREERRKAGGEEASVTHFPQETPTTGNHENFGRLSIIS